MTAPKPTSRKVVERVFQSLGAALQPELAIEQVGEEPERVPAEQLFAAPEPPTHSPRGLVLWQAFQSAGAARARFVRRELFQNARKRGGELATLDDTRKDRAMVRLRDALRLVGEATQALVDDMAAVTAMAERYGVALEEDADLEEAAAGAARIEQGLNGLLEQMNCFKGIPQIRTQREWDRFLSETASEMLEVGFSPREVAAILSGTPENKVTTATLERFRQRVRRLKSDAP